ncbi:MAG: Lon family ATP-dependent protease, partial [Selenomonas sp.]
MLKFFKRLFSSPAAPAAELPQDSAAERLDREIDALYSILADEAGSDRLVIKAGKMDAMRLMRSPVRGERVLALERIVYENPTIERVPSESEIPSILVELSERIADIMARRSMEDKIEQKIQEKLEENHQDYVQDIRMQVLKDEKSAIESPQAAKKREELEALEKVHLTQSVMELLRPKTLEEVVGQERAVKALASKLASPYPQHLLLYGPPGVGKTTAARIVLEAVKKETHSPFAENAPFVETDGTTLRWDSRDMTNPLLGSVHDPIYQGARRDLADGGIPEPKPGMVTEAHGGILFIDEIGEMDEMLQNKLLKVLEDKRAFFESAYYDHTDEKVPPYIRKLFEDGAPADFVLIGATTRDASHINPALRSRCAEIYFEPLTPKHIEEIVRNAAKKLKVEVAEEVVHLISEYTTEGRKAINILADAYSLALSRTKEGEDVKISKADIYEVAQVSRLYQFVTKKASKKPEVGHVFGLGVAGFLGSVIEIEAVVFPAEEKGKGQVRFNETAGSMAKDSVFNAASVLRHLTGKSIHDYDVHINVVGGGNIDGPS